MDVVVYHNPACGTSRNTLGLIRNAGVEPHIIEYLKTPPARALLKQLLERAGLTVRDILREKGTPFAELGLGDPGLSDEDLLDAMATAQPDLIRRFGGHAMAAGLSIADGDYSRFATLFDQTARQWIAPEVLEGIVLSDGILPVAALTLEVARQLRYGGPWGQHFPEPLFEGEFELLQRRIVGGHHLKMLLASAEGGEPLDAIAFRFDLDQLEQLPNRLRLAYRLDLNRYRGETRLQLVVEHWEAT